MTATKRFLAVLLVVMPLASSVSARAATPDGVLEQTPEQVLVEETLRTRAVIADDPEFLARMEQYQGLTAIVGEVSALSQQFGPLLDELEMMRHQFFAAGVLDLLADLDPDLAFVKPLLEALLVSRDVLDKLDAFTNGMTLLSADIDRVLTAETLTVDDMQAVRTGLPNGRQALLDAASAYGLVRPGLDGAMRQLEALRGELEAALGQAVGLIGPLDASRQMRAMVAEGFATVHAFKEDLDAMADHAAEDAALLTRLEGALFEAEAHHAFSLATALMRDGHIEGAEEAFHLVIAQYPQTTWAGHAEELLAQGLAAVAADGADEPFEARGLGVLLAVLAATLLLGLGYVLWSRRAERRPSGTVEVP